MALLKIIGCRCLLVLAICYASAQRAGGADLVAEEYQVKAAFLFNFAKFVEWPPAALAAKDQISICIIGNDSFASVVKKTVSGKRIATHDFTVRSLPVSAQDGLCHILFISNSERGRQAAILRGFEALYVLTIGESDDFLMDGGVINLTLRDARMRIQINTKAAARANVRISSKLLNLSETTK